MNPLEAHLPHRGPAIVLDRVRAFSEDGCVAEACVHPGAWYLDEQGAMPAWVGLEMMAQAAAAFSGHRNTLSGLPIRVGYLLGSRAFKASVPSFPVGTPLEIHVRVVFLDPDGLGAFHCELRQAGTLVAEATLKAIEPS